MTKAEANDNIGKEFKPLIDGARFDIIRRVDDDGNIHGDFTTAHHEDCRLKQEQPEQLKKTNK